MAFKDVYDRAYLERLGRQLEEVGVLGSESFLDSIVEEVPTLEMKARCRLIGREIVAQSGIPYKELMEKLVGLLDEEHPFRDGVSSMDASTWRGFTIWPFTMIVAEEGLNDWETSFWAMNQFTRRFTAEFCIRPFLRQDATRVLQYLTVWVSDPSEHVRRLVSEGTRPFLPWGLGVPALAEHRDTIVGLLERLRADDSEYVRRSVANHLNDLSRLDPDLVKDLCRRWLAEDSGHMPLARHALRTLIKQGDPGALEIMGFGGACVKCLSFKVSPPVVKFPGVLEIQAELEADGDVLVDFTIEFATQGGKLSKKTFKWFVKRVDSKSLIRQSKRVSFKPKSTRKFCSGAHRVLLHVNGETLGEAEFQLLVD